MENDNCKFISDVMKAFRKQQVTNLEFILRPDLRELLPINELQYLLQMGFEYDENYNRLIIKYGWVGMSKYSVSLIVLTENKYYIGFDEEYWGKYHLQSRRLDSKMSNLNEPIIEFVRDFLKRNKHIYSN